jgi:hypothetical protein
MGLLHHVCKRPDSLREIERCRKVAVRVDLLLQFRDLLLRTCVSRLHRLRFDGEMTTRERLHVRQAKSSAGEQSLEFL